MHTYQNRYMGGAWQQPLSKSTQVDLVLIFGDAKLMQQSEINAQICECFPSAEIIGCSTSGEILGSEVTDQSLCLSAISFDRTPIQVVSEEINGRNIDVIASGLSQKLAHKDLKYVMVLSDGQKVNGTALAKGLEAGLPSNILITGGLAGDNTKFEKTHVWHNDRVSSDMVLVCGLYGDAVSVGHGCKGGWEAFGPTRQITKASENVLYSLDEKPALELYKTYLGKHADDLPCSALLYPLLVQRGNEEAVTRTILNIDENQQSMIFAGDIPLGGTAQLMRANFMSLIEGAGSAAESAFKAFANDQEGFALLISCVGRRLVLKTRTEEELESVQSIAGKGWALSGFYSYGEISPLVSGDGCALHNQTMTITTIHERNT